MWNRTAPKFKVTSEIRDMLLKSGEVAHIVGDKIFPIVAPEKTEGIYVTYQREQYGVDRTKMGAAMETCQVYIFVVGDKYAESQDLAEKIFIALNGDHSNGLRIWLNDSTEDITGEGQNKKYVQVLLFEISNH